MAGTTLTPAQVKKVEAAVVAQTWFGRQSEKQQAQTRRFADKHARHALGLRGTGPHSHGLDAKQRAALRTALNEALGVNAKPKAVSAPATKPAAKKTKAKGVTAGEAQAQSDTSAVQVPQQ